ncbi:SDR family oxidoreductase [Cohnella kolymensis]|uniref:SDR family oxidoreductase n=1 Tax=Cohnella kolymensis TaxID=1590652 RepID=UPI0038990161
MGSRIARHDDGGSKGGIHYETPLARLCTPDDVAKAVGFLASPEADFITGEAMDITGGAHMM